MPIYSLYSFHGGCKLDIDICENLANTINSYSYPMYLQRYDPTIPYPQSAIVNINIKTDKTTKYGFKYMFNSNGEPSRLGKILSDDLKDNLHKLIPTNKIGTKIYLIYYPLLSLVSPQQFL